FGQTATSIPDGQEAKILGVITARSADSIVVATLDNSMSYNVMLTGATSVKSNTKGVFRGGTRYETSYLLRGLRVQVEGHGDSNGAIVAKSVRFNEQDLKTAQSLESRFAPLEAQASATAAQAASNTERIAAAEENARKMSGQIDENSAAAAAAMKEAERANNRINGLDDFDPIKTIVVPFATGSSTIGPKGKSIIDEAAAWVKTQDRNGWMVAVVGFADSTGKTAANKTLSERRANAVIGYLVTKYNMPLHRLIQPFGAGQDMPAATNSTTAGRAANRRVEIRLLKNKGIAGE
ncbi:MAG TPA: OmpA family protein, partial [Pyrinomonadaceae bacterium]|nr:OmpA family protein [Pyrinomonadaceae bacterium]